MTETVGTKRDNKQFFKLTLKTVVTVALIGVHIDYTASWDSRRSADTYAYYKSHFDLTMPRLNQCVVDLNKDASM